MTYKDIINKLRAVMDEARDLIDEDTPQGWHLSLIDDLINEDHYKTLCEAEQAIRFKDVYGSALLPYLYGNMGEPDYWVPDPSLDDEIDY